MHGDMLTLTLFLAASYLAGAAGALFIKPTMRGWYITLRRPSWAPPRWVFRVVWAALNYDYWRLNR
jgi:tryptophan-rich sensory protein